MAKPLPVRVPSDDCVVTIDGDEYHPHEGEWVVILRGVSVGKINLLRRLNTMASKIAAVQGDTDENQRVAEIVGAADDDAITMLRDRIVAWSWTDGLGRPLPQPIDDVAVFDRLAQEELYYLVSLTKAESPDEQKNGSRPSPTISSGSARTRNRK